MVVVGGRPPPQPWDRPQASIAVARRCKILKSNVAVPGLGMLLHTPASWQVRSGRAAEAARPDWPRRGRAAVARPAASPDAHQARDLAVALPVGALVGD